MPDRAADYAVEYAKVWRERGVRAWHEAWWELPRRVGDQIGSLMHAPVDTVSMQANVTSAHAVVLSCFDVGRERDKVVMVDMEFPSTLYLYRAWLRGHGRLELVPSDGSIGIDSQRVVDAIDDTTMLVSLSHVLFRSAYIMEIGPIVKRAHEVGAYVMLDVFQSLGTVPVDVMELNVDFAVGGCLKWLCGGPGACFLYVRPDLLKSLTPRITGWMAHREPFDFDTGAIEYADGSYRFMNGTPSIPALYACQAGLEIVSEVGVESIRRRSTEMTSSLLSMAHERGWKTTAPTSTERRGGTIAIDVPNGREIAGELNARDVLVDYRPKAGIRLSPHFYNTDAELQYAVEQIEAIISDGSWRRHLDAARIVT